MIGYCQDCSKNREMKEVETVQLRNSSYVHKGACVKCEGLMYKSLRDTDLIVTKSRRFYPKEIYVGKNTPKRILKVDVGQTIIEKNKKKVLSGKGFETLEELKKKEKENEKKDVSSRFRSRPPARR